VAGYRLSFLMAVGLIAAAAAIVLIQLRRTAAEPPSAIQAASRFRLLLLKQAAHISAVFMRWPVMAEARLRLRRNARSPTWLLATMTTGPRARQPLSNVR
jgi:hypothetical protein